MRLARTEDPYKDFPKSDMWMLFVDGHRWNEGPLAFDAHNQVSGENPEPGYIEGMTTAQNFMTSHLSEPISAKFIEQVHDICISPIAHLRTEVKGYRDGGSGFALLINTIPGEANGAVLSTEGLKDLATDLQAQMRTRIRHNKFPVNLIIYQPNNATLSTSYVVYNDPSTIEAGMLYYRNNKIKPENAVHITTAELQQRMEQNDPRQGAFVLVAGGSDKTAVAKWSQEDVLAYHNDIKAAQMSGDKDQVLTAIVKFVRHGLQSHHFKDANGRTFVPLMLNHLLVQNGFTPAINMTPNHFSGFSLNELVVEVKAGMQMFNACRVTQATEVIRNLSPQEIRVNPDKARALIAQNLSQNPMIRLAQLNEIHKQVKNGDTQLKNLILLKWLKKNDTGGAAIADILKSLYQESLQQLKDRKLNENIVNQITEPHVLHQESMVAAKTTSVVESRENKGPDF